ncbi:Pentatricopeptide repeat-containing protein [Thalictrum thalictroides]|uniref:Pentatricopeptide repeat-containing protein n=1 Tax=Thalictrum thalictroides TaxID=46969 RepID=A0A7J6XBF3_THATH|nr:Pentatricopeptide repeat-containing protein [Thalictrum thalictroides]
MGRGVHGRVIKCGFEEDVFVGTAIVDLYAKCGDINDAVEGFLGMQVRNVVSWTAIISAFVQREDSGSALKFFKEMRREGVEVNNYTLTCVLAACAKPQMMNEAIQIHSYIVKCGFDSNCTVVDSLINVYSKMGQIGFSKLVFKESGSAENAETWAVMISGFAQNRSLGSAFELLEMMIREGLRPNTSCWSSVLSIIDCIYVGRQTHCYILKNGMVSDICVGSALFTMYSKCGSLEEAYVVFEQIHDRDRVSWTSMLAGFAEHGYVDRAFDIFRNMVHEDIKPDPMTLSAILTACSVLPSLQKGKEVHAYALLAGLGGDTLVSGGLVTMYSKCGVLVSARRVFELMPQKDKVSWSSLISGYAQNGYVEEALLQYHEMLVAGMNINSFTITSLLGMAATLTISALGKQLHVPIVKIGIGSDPPVGNSLITMYSKCGSIEDSNKVFDQIEHPDLIAWTSMIMGYAQNGKGMDALRLYDLMRSKGLKPDPLTFVGVLSACSHSGLVEEGYNYFNSMTKNHGIKPGSHHYACMVDILGRAGRLEEAERFIANMSIKPDALVWGTLLASCKVHGDVELGRLAAKHILKLQPTEVGAYVSLSNILADMGQWDEVANIRKLMMGVGAKKEPGWSSL